MQSLRATDGSPIHRKAIRFHVAKCRTGVAPLHADLHAEGAAVYKNLRVCTRAHEDAEDNLVEANADVDTTEIAFENAIRELDGALAAFDRDNPGKDARSAIFPDGFGAVIEPEGDRQLDVLPALHVRLDPFKNEAALSAPLSKLSAAEAAFKTVLAAEDAASDAVDAAFAKEIAARGAVRAQLTSAHGRLRDLYKSQPAQAERFFLKMGRKEGKPKGSGGGAGGAPPA